MNDASTHDIKVLNELITTTLDSVDGYSEAAKEAANPTFKTLFSQWASERRQVANDLQQQVRALGGRPEDEGSALASAHRVFLNLRDSMSKGDKGVVKKRNAARIISRENSKMRWMTTIFRRTSVPSLTRHTNRWS